MAGLIVKLNWDYVTIVYSDDAFGEANLAVWQNISQKHHICAKDTIAATLKDKDGVINRLNKQVTSEHAGILYFGSQGIGRFIAD